MNVDALLDELEVEATRDLLADALELPRELPLRTLAIEAATVIRLSRLGDAMSRARPEAA